MTFSGYGSATTPQQQAATPASGIALVNATPTLLSWAVPNDGKLHIFQITMSLNVTTLEVGGEIDLNYTTADGTALSGIPLFAGGLAAGVSAAFFSRLVKAGTTVTITQQALTGGAAVTFGILQGA